MTQPCRYHMKREEKRKVVDGNIAQDLGAKEKKESTKSSVRVTQQIRTNGPTLGGDK